MFSAYFKKRILKRELSKYISADRVDAIVEGRLSLAPKIQSGNIEFIFALVRADSIELLVERVGVAIEITSARGAVIHHIVGPLLVIAFGTLASARHSPGARAELVTELNQRLGGDIKIVHGSAAGHYGNLGSGKWVRYGFTFQHFDVALAALGRLEYGQTEVFRP